MLALLIPGLLMGGGTIVVPPGPFLGNIVSITFSAAVTAIEFDATPPALTY